MFSSTLSFSPGRRLRFGARGSDALAVVLRSSEYRGGERERQEKEGRGKATRADIDNGGGYQERHAGGPGRLVASDAERTETGERDEERSSVRACAGRHDGREQEQIADGGTRWHEQMARRDG